MRYNVLLTITEHPTQLVELTSTLKNNKTTKLIIIEQLFIPNPSSKG